MEKSGKIVLLTSNGDIVSQGIAFHLAKQGCRLVLMGEERCLQIIAHKMMGSLSLSGRDADPVVQVVPLDMEDESESTFHHSVDKACWILGKLDAFVNCYTYEGKMQENFEVAESEFKKIVKINFMAAWFLLKAVGQRMQDFDNRGSIMILTSIIGAERGLYPGAAAYASTLAGFGFGDREVPGQS